MVVANAVPPADAAYHFIAVPLAVRLAIVGAGLAQKVCEADAVGAAVVGVTVMVIVAVFAHNPAVGVNV